VKKLLENNGCGMRAMIFRYDGHSPLEAEEFALEERGGGLAGGSLAAYGGQWECECIATELPGRKGAMDVEVRFRLGEGVCQSVGVGVAFDFDQWSPDNYVLMPGAVYGGNRFRCVDQQYPPLFDDPADHRVDLPLTVTNIPRLNIEEGPSCIEQTTGDLATPAMGFYAPDGQSGFWVLTQQATALGNSGMFISESDDRSHASFMVTAPSARRERQALCHRVATDDRGVDWRQGQEVSITLQLHFFATERLQGFFDYFAAIRQSLSKGSASHHIIPFSHAARTIEDKQNALNWVEDKGYYSTGMWPREKLYENWQLGWVGGCMVTLPLLFAGAPLSRKRALRNLETILTQTQAPSGFFYGIGNGQEWYGDGFAFPHPYNMHMVRKSADALFFFLRHLMLLEAQEPEWTAPQEWQGAVKRLADTFVALWERYGQYGQFVDVETGDLLVGGSSSGGAIPGALALAGQYFGCDHYLAIAEASARRYYAQDIGHGLTTGGPGEILQCPDSESAFALLESFVVLYEATGKAAWLRAAEDTAKHCATWCVSYDYAFPPASIFGKLAIRSSGSVFANAQNKHSAPGICTMSGDCLLKLYRATGKIFYLDLLREIAHNITQYVATEERPLGALKPGFVDERVNLSDWEGKEGVGLVTGTGYWPEVSVLLTWTEVPGVYLEPDTGAFYVFDHVEVKLGSVSDHRVDMTLYNPTAFPAKVRVLIESSEQRAKPLGFNALLNCPTVAIEAQQEMKISLTF